MNSESSSNTNQERRKSAEYLNEEPRTDSEPSSNKDMKPGRLNDERKGGYKRTDSETKKVNP